MKFIKVNIETQAHCKSENSSWSPGVHQALTVLPEEKMPRNSWNKKMAALKTRRP